MGSRWEFPISALRKVLPLPIEQKYRSELIISSISEKREEANTSLYGRTRGFGAVTVHFVFLPPGNLARVTQCQVRLIIPFREPDVSKTIFEGMSLAPFVVLVKSHFPPYYQLVQTNLW